MVPADPAHIDGLSPRLRGNHLIAAHPAHINRSIPAPAGEPSGWRSEITPVPVYPRACGGTERQPLMNGIVYGLSPRLRGNQALCRYAIL